MKRPIRLLTLLLAWLLLITTVYAQEVSLFDIRTRPAIDLVPQVNALLGDEGSASAYGNRLIVRASAERLEEVRWLLSELDRPARNLLVEVRVDSERSGTDQSAGVRLRDLQADVHFRRHTTRRDGDSVQRVRTLDGRPALIRMGQSVPVYQVERGGQGSDRTERLEVRYKDIHTGIVVLPRSHADNVTVEVYQQAESPAVASGVFNTQQADTVVSGKMGDWIPMGSIDAAGRSHDTGIGYRASTGIDNRRYLSVRVTPVSSQGGNDHAQ